MGVRDIDDGEVYFWHFVSDSWRGYYTDRSG